MEAHDEYGKKILSLAADGGFVQSGRPVEIDYGAGHPARIDGAIAGVIAVEVESRTSKQVRGAVLDLICHPFPKKLLILLPVHMKNPEITAKQTENIFARFIAREDFIVLVLRGSGRKSDFANDVALVKSALARLGFRLINEQSSQLRNLTRIPVGIEPRPPHKSQQPRGKYGPLERHLRALSHETSHLILTFNQIEEILGISLPPSAFKRREWWANQKDVSNRPQAKAWIDAGFQVDSVRQNSQDAWVKFVRQ